MARCFFCSAVLALAFLSGPSAASGPADGRGTGSGGGSSGMPPAHVEPEMQTTKGRTPETARTSDAPAVRSIDDARERVEASLSEPQMISSFGPSQVGLSVAVLVFAFAVLGLVAFMRTKEVIGGDVTFKLFGLCITVGAALFLITAGYSQQQITPVIGMLGTALGFIFGRNSEPAVQSDPASTNQPATLRAGNKAS